MKKFSNPETELTKCVVYKKARSPKGITPIKETALTVEVVNFFEE